MATIITGDSIEKHNVDKYNFKVIALGANDEAEQSPQYTSENHPKARVTDVDSSALSQSSKDSLIESLMQKTDDMSSNFIKLQMKLEAKEEEHVNELKKAKEEAFAEGMKAGEAKAMEDIDKNLNVKLTLLEDSIKKLDTSAQEFASALEGIKNELVVAALDISKEVLKVELSENSAEVAKVLSDELIKELQSASKIELKINPKDYASVSEHLGSLQNVKVLSDSAVSEGGVIVMSDAGNIDAQISKRFQRVKKAALGE
ncbi:flagellar assembly protein FliH [Sulfurimonas sp.]|uniref:flagellar assembly protein FliH n=1 Tax=Sulfurimonas sp. TaxID=2022749 RepID=UPI00261534DB|nr:flagellar assembly protein FliH [Sulfurimonas sp.]